MSLVVREQHEFKTFKGCKKLQFGGSYFNLQFQTEWVFLCQLFFNSLGNNFRSFNLDKWFFLHKPQYFALLGADVYSSFSELAIEPLSVCMNFVYKNSEIGNKAIKQFRFIVS